MSAPEPPTHPALPATTGATRKAAMAEVAQTEIPDSWIQQFQNDVAAHPTARAAWEEIKDAGLREGALLLLRGYAGGADSDIRGMHQRTEYANGRMKAAIRAKAVAHTSTPKRA